MFLTVEEAADILRIGRTTAYSLTKQWRSTNGAAGLPVVNFGHKLRVPLHRLEALAGGAVGPPRPDAVRNAGGGVPEPGDTAEAVPTSPAEGAAPDLPTPIPTQSTNRSSTRRRPRPAAAGQPSLFGEAS